MFDRTTPATLLLDLWAHGLAAVHPARLLAGLSRQGDQLLWQGRPLLTKAPQGHFQVLALGKAAPQMCQALVGALGEDTRWVCVGPDQPTDLPGQLWVEYQAQHPLPGPGSLAGGLALLAAAQGLGPGDAALVLLSGGASSLAVVPRPPLTLEDLRRTYDALLRSGASVQEMNAVRRKLCLLKGGGLAAACAPAPVATLLLSDVVGGGPEDVGSGPTLPDPGDAAPALNLLERYAPQAPRAVLEFLKDFAPTPHPLPGGRGSDPIVLASNSTLLTALAAQAEALGYPVAGLLPEVRTDAATLAQNLAALTQQALASPLGRGPFCILAGGEAPVKVSGPGHGGRCRHLALLLLPFLAAHPDLALLAAASDGLDGHPDAAGTLAFTDTLAQGRAAGLDHAATLAACDSARWFQATQDALPPSPTGTNVADVVVLLHLPL
jgi:glycerate 2-kinase